MVTSRVNVPTLAKPHLWDYIAEFIQRKGVSWVRLAEELGMPVTTLKSWLQRNAYPAWAVEKIFGHLGIPIPWGTSFLIQTFEFKIARTYAKPWDDTGTINDTQAIPLENAVYPSESSVELKRIISTIREWSQSYSIVLEWAEGTGKTWVISSLVGLPRLSYKPEDPSQPLLQLVTGLSEAIVQPIQIRTYQGLTNALLSNIGQFPWVIFDGIEHLDNASRASIFWVIGELIEKTRWLVFLYTDNSDLSVRRSHVELQIQSQSLPFRIQPFTYRDLHSMVTTYMPHLSKNEYGKIIEEIQKFWSHRELTFIFIRCLKEHWIEGWIDEAIVETQKALREVITRISQQHIETISHLQTENIESDNWEVIIQYDSSQLDWSVIRSLLWTTLFRFFWGKLVTTPYIHEQVLEVATTPAVVP